MRAATKAPLKCLASASLLVGAAELDWDGAAEVLVGALEEVLTVAVVIDAISEEELDSAADEVEAVVSGAEAVVSALTSLVTTSEVVATRVTVEFSADVVGNLDLNVRN